MQYLHVKVPLIAVCLISGVGRAEQVLPTLKPIAKQAMVSEVSQLSDGLPIGEALWLVGGDVPSLLTRTTWQPEGKTAKQVFGPIVDERRIKLEQPNDLEPVGLALYKDRAMFIDGREFAIAYFSPADGKILGVRTTPWDMIRPPADRGGEPTRHETKEIRAKFKRAMAAAPPTRLRGWAQVPAKYHKSKYGGPSYLAFTAVPGFPFVMLECRADEPAQCYVTRECRWRGQGSLQDRFGLTWVDDSRQLLTAGTDGTIYALKFQSCWSISGGKPLLKVSDVGPIAGLRYEADRLWVFTRARDPEHHASTYFWKNPLPKSQAKTERPH